MRVEQIVRQAQAFGQKAVALTDSGGLYAGVAFYKACLEAGIKPILGAELHAADGRAVLLARSHAGYQALCRLITAYRRDPGIRLAERLAENGDHLFILCPDAALLHQLAPLNQAAPSQLPPVWALLERFNTPASRENERRILAAAGSLNLPLVAANDVHFLSPGEYPLHQMLRAIDEGATLASLSPERPLARQASPDACFKSPDEMEALFRDLPEAIRNTERIAEACNLELPLGVTEFPCFPLPAGESAFSFLWKLCFEGVRSRYKPLTPRVVERLHHEMAIIEEKNLAAYFLIVWDIVRYCGEKGIPCVGRGSAADSLVAHVLGITPGCPLEYDLYFERFLNRERKGAPDIDLDLCWRRRDEVLQYVYKKYGEEHVAMICTYNTFCARSALREVAKVHGLPPGEIKRLMTQLPGYGSVAQLEKNSRTLPEMHSNPLGESLYSRILETARALDGLPRHLATHACGIVISPEPLTDKVPLQIAAKGLQITQYDMHGAEDIGLLKIDLLGQRSLSVIADVVRDARDPEGNAIQLSELPLHDEGTWRLVNDGRTVGCFQLESPGMRQLLQKLNVEGLETLIDSISVIRPGPNDAGMMRHYVDRHNGKEPVRYLDPRLEPILKSTHGILLYQEDILKVASVIAGMTLGEADVLRRAMTKLRAPENMEANRTRFIEGAIANGTAPEVAAELWRQVSGFAGYAFCKAHSVSYGILAFQSAYLKQHFPALFMAAVINNGGGFYSTAVYVEEARRMGLKILPPDILESRRAFTADADSLRVGLGWIRQLSRKSIARILEQRRMKPFSSLEDFYRRTALSVPELDHLIRCGALDCFGQSRPQLRWQLDLLTEAKSKTKHHADEALFSQIDEDETQPRRRKPLPSIHDISLDEKMAWELDVLGFTITMHPIAYLRARPENRAWTPVADLHAQAGKQVSVAGIVRTTKRTRTKQGQMMKFITLEDETGLLDAVLFPASYQRWGRVLPHSRLLVVSGKVQNDHGALTLAGERVKSIRLF